MSSDLDSINRTDSQATATIIPLTADESRQVADIEWAQQDPHVLQRYKGEFVVPYVRQIVAHGQEIRSVLEQAVQKTGKNIQELPVIGIDDSLTDVTAP